MKNKIIRLSESDIKTIIHESIKSLLTENKESKNMSKARNIVRQFNPNLDAQEIITAVRNDLPNSRLEHCKYLPGVTKMVMNNEINHQNRVQFNDTLGMISKGHSNEYDGMLNDMSAEDLIKRFGREINNEFQQDVENHNNTQFTANNDYTIIRITSPEEAAKYGKYTNWCITSSEESAYDDDYEYDEDDEYYDEDDEYHDKPARPTLGEVMYDNYTNGGGGVFYFCLKNGFQNIPKEPGEGCPLDEYGLSMIATSVDTQGKCQTITCRWNHDHGGNDNIMTPMELSKIIGRNYYQTFKPYTKEELHAKGYITPDEVPTLLASNGTKIFDNIQYTNIRDISIGRLHKQYILFNNKTKTLLNNVWCKSIGKKINDGIVIVKDYRDNYNYMKLDGTMLLKNNESILTLEPFTNGHGAIKRYHRNDDGYEYTLEIIDDNGNFVTPRPIVFHNIFPNNIAIGKTGFIIDNGGERELYDFNGNAIAMYHNIHAYENGNYYVSDEDGHVGIMNKNFQLFGNRLYDYINQLQFGMYISSNGKEWLVKPNGKLLGGRKFDRLTSFNREGVYEVLLNNKINIIDAETDQYLLPMWCDGLQNISFSRKNGISISIMTVDDKSTLIDNHTCKQIIGWYGKLFTKKWINNKIFINDGSQYINTTDMKVYDYTPQEQKQDNDYINDIENEIRYERMHNY